MFVLESTAHDAERHSEGGGVSDQVVDRDADGDDDGDSVEVSVGDADVVGTLVLDGMRDDDGVTDADCDADGVSDSCGVSEDVFESVADGDAAG